MADLKSCGVCYGEISDRYIMRVADTSYHERCLLCTACGVRLTHTCFAKENKLLCRLDYDRLYGKKCLGCSELISADELVMRALDSIFHLRCFICVVCGSRLQRGDQFVIKQGQLFCRPDYEKEVEMLEGFCQGEFSCEELPSSRAQDGRRGPKRPRTILTTQQRRAFKASFEISPKPCRKIRETLAKDTGLSVRIVQGPKRQHTMLTNDQREAFKQYFQQCPKPGCKVRESIARETGLTSRIVQVWFQNQRAKMKKIQKKARQENKCKDGGESEDEKKNKIKEEGSPNGRSFLNDDSDTNASNAPNSENFTIGNNVEDQNSYLPIKQEIPENEGTGFFKISATLSDSQLYPRNYCQRDINDKLEPRFLGLPYHEVAHHHQIFLPQGSALGINPIDRLYSMQNSYFCGQDSQIPDN